jgi:aminopeptidase YwaD
LERGIKIAFWPGHSNGRYLGSTWYCDNFWKELHDNCIAHINIDSPGSKGAEVALPRTTMLEGVEFTSELIKEFFGEYPESFAEIPRGADQSFWGVDVPFHIMYKYEPAKDNKIYNCPGSGGGWWWHTEYDSLDKLDIDILMRDTRLNFATAYHLAMTKRLPVKFEAYFLKQKETIETIIKNTDNSFDFQSILKALSSLSDKVLDVIKKVSNDEKANKIIKEIGGGMNRIVYSSGSEYDFDNTFPSKPFPGLQHLLNVYKSNTPKEQFLFAMTAFVRQRNRIVNEMYKLERNLDMFCL